MPERLTIGKLAVWGKSRPGLSPAVAKRPVRGIHTDSRKVGSGDLFIALKTRNDDGHRYVESAFAAGATAAVVAAKNKKSFPARIQKKLIAVPDPLKALQRMAQAYRKELGILMIGLTGSNGKTTTRNAIAHVLERGYPVGTTAGNFNNHIGVPLSILSFTGKEWLGVIEMGANHVREIHTLSMIVKPDIALITNIGYAHVGLFKSLENTTTAKFEIVDGLNKRNGFLMINGDDHRLFKRAQELGIQTTSYGFSSRCTVRATSYELLSANRARFEVEGHRFTLPMPGRHFVYSALPAIILARRLGIDRTDVVDALQEISPVSLRGVIRKKKNATFVLDCYNANPSSMKAGLQLLDDIAAKSEKVAIVGDMLELGSASNRLHKQLGKLVYDSGVKRALAVGEYADSIAEGAVKAGMKAKNIATARSAEEALDRARKIIKPGNAVLVKGSRRVHLETVFENL
ncbi:MAG: UDP-N-acetylmuramoyl-tripeptide--D-alanyl-D-alanine ligase [Chitinivibrionales bacterium]|nr:UDP-N-acetylmuramoyl-tripeptide--D-alanyl-D-alanine ligase [Chitinivibrionales bacterium]